MFGSLLQWLGQDAVKARLLKEAQTVNEGLQASIGEPYSYTFSAAETLTDDFKRLGSAADGSTYLDCLRQLLIGNLLACLLSDLADTVI